MSRPISQPNGHLHRIGEVAKQTGLTTHTIRVWERRYGAIEPDRTDGGTRLYSAEQVERLRLLKRLTDLGHGIGAIATLPREKLEQLLPAPTAPSATTSRFDQSALLEHFFAALGSLDTEAMEAILGRAALELSPRELVLRVAAPLAAELGSRWEAGQIAIAQEHAASARLRDLLGRLRVNTPAPPGAPKLVAATLSGDRHELGLLMATLLAALCGWRAVYLGVDLPIPEIVDAAERSRASAVLISLVHVEPLAARGLLREMRERLPAQVSIFAGGRAASQIELEGVHRPADLASFESDIHELLQEQRTRPSKI